MYAVAMIFLCMNNIVAIVDISFELTGQRAPNLIRPTKSSVGSLSTGYHIANTAYFITSILSFISTWFATVLLLQHYSTKIRKSKVLGYCKYSVSVFFESVPDPTNRFIHTL